MKDLELPSSTKCITSYISYEKTFLLVLLVFVLKNDCLLLSIVRFLFTHVNGKHVLISLEGASSGMQRKYFESERKEMEKPASSV